jgi:Glycosyl hydrolase family 65, C-terminal domain
MDPLRPNQRPVSSFEACGTWPDETERHGHRRRQQDGRRPSELERLSTQVRYRRYILDLEIDHEMLRVSSRPFTAPPVTIAYP